MRFELIDRIIDQQDDRLVAVKCVSTAEEYLADHFPAFAVFPGVLMLEVLVQAGRALIAGIDEATLQDPPILAEARNVRYGNIVRPGQSLRVEVTLRKKTDDGWDMEGTGSVEDQIAVQAKFSLKAVGRFIKTSARSSND